VASSVSQSGALAVCGTAGGHAASAPGVGVRVSASTLASQAKSAINGGAGRAEPADDSSAGQWVRLASCRWAWAKDAEEAAKLLAAAPPAPQPDAPSAGGDGGDAETPRARNRFCLPIEQPSARKAPPPAARRGRKQLPGCSTGPLGCGHARSRSRPSKHRWQEDIMEAVCCVCRGKDATDENDLALCDMCDRGFHQQCHDPPVSSFGTSEDQWFCAECTAKLAKRRGLSLSAGDFAWVALQRPVAAAAAGAQPPWPARVLSVAFTSASEKQPYSLRLYGGRAGVEDIITWASKAQAWAWALGPGSPSSDAEWRRAVQVAVADGAPELAEGKLEDASEPILC